MWSDSDNTCSAPPPFDWCDGNALRNPYSDEILNTETTGFENKFSAPGNVDSGFGYQPVCYLNAPEQNCRGKPYRFNIQGRAPGISNTPIASPFMCVAQTAFKFRWSRQQAQEENGGLIEEDNWSKKWTNFHTHLVDLTGDDKLDLVITYTPVYEHKPDEQPAQGVPPRRIRAWKNTGTNSVPIYQVPLDEQTIFADIITYQDTSLAFVDLDKDGLMDVLVAAQEDLDFKGSDGKTVRVKHPNYEAGGELHSFRWFKNIGTSSQPSFKENTVDVKMSPRQGPWSSVEATADAERAKAERFTVDVDSPIPVFGDLDFDGDMDLIVGIKSEPKPTILYFENVRNDDSTDLAFILRRGIDNPFNGFDSLGVPLGLIHLALGDIDNDGDLDLLVAGENINTHLLYLENTGSKYNPTFTLRMDKNPFQRLGQTLKATTMDSDSDKTGLVLSIPVFVDVDGDSDLDLLIGHGAEIIYFKYGPAEDFFWTDHAKAVGNDQESPGGPGGPITNDLRYTQNQGDWNPFTKINPDIGEGGNGLEAASALGDIDNDGDFDLVVGTKTSGIHFYKNVGSATSPLFSDHTGNGKILRYSLFKDESIHVHERSDGDIPDFWFRNRCKKAVPAMGDLNGDSRIDLLVGCKGGKLLFVNDILGVGVNSGGDRDGVHFAPGAPACSTCGAAATKSTCFSTPSCDTTAGYLDFITLFSLKVVGIGKTSDDNTEVFPILYDMDGDGKLDLLIGNSMNSILLYLKNIGTALVPNFSTDDIQDGQCNKPNAADCDSMILLHSDRNVNNGEKNIASDAIVPRSVGLHPAVVDLNNDGVPDVVTGSREGTLSFWRGTRCHTNNDATQPKVEQSWKLVGMGNGGFTKLAPMPNPAALDGIHCLGKTSEASCKGTNNAPLRSCNMLQSLDTSSEVVNNELVFSAPHGLPDGTPIVYRGNSVTAISELIDGTTYYVRAGSDGNALTRLKLFGNEEGDAAPETFSGGAAGNRIQYSLEEACWNAAPCWWKPENYNNGEKDVLRGKCKDPCEWHPSVKDDAAAEQNGNANYIQICDSHKEHPHGMNARLYSLENADITNVYAELGEMFDGWPTYKKNENGNEIVKPFDDNKKSYAFKALKGESAIDSHQDLAMNNWKYETPAHNKGPFMKRIQAYFPKGFGYEVGSSNSNSFGPDRRKHPTIADIDGDGIFDLLLANPSSQFSFFQRGTCSQITECNGNGKCAISSDTPNKGMICDVSLGSGAGAQGQFCKGGYLEEKRKGGATLSFIAKPSCVKCEKGKWSYEIGRVEDKGCVACVAGLYNDETGKSSPNGDSPCKTCLAGQSSDVGSAKCQSCEAGMYSNVVGGTCQNCVQGQYRQSKVFDGGVRTDTTTDATTCVSCPTGWSASTTASTRCSECTAGKYANTAGTDCIDCGQGKYSENNAATDCKDCRKGQYLLSTGGTVCYDCQPGTYEDTVGGSTFTDHGNGNKIEFTSCKGCDVGRFMNTPASELPCKKCVVGYYQNLEKSSSCIECPAGQFSQDNTEGKAQSCTECPINTYNGHSGQGECKNCGVGEGTKVKGSTRCDTCIPGRAGDPCADCVSGKYRDSNSPNAAVCIDCPTGYSVGEGSAACIPCSPGKYAPTTALSVCKDCGLSSYTDKTTQIECNQCNIGQSTSLPGSTRCQKCIPGSAGNACDPCIAGKYRGLLDDPKECVDCPKGWNTEERTGLSECLRCDAGKFSINVMSSLCTECPNGFYQDDRGQTACKSKDTCTGGKVPNSIKTLCEKADWSVASDCELGAQYLDNKDQDKYKHKCVKCADGKLQKLKKIKM